MLIDVEEMSFLARRHADFGMLVEEGAQGGGAGLNGGPPTRKWTFQGHHCTRLSQSTSGVPSSWRIRLGPEGGKQSLTRRRRVCIRASLAAVHSRRCLPRKSGEVVSCRHERYEYCRNLMYWLCTTPSPPLRRVEKISLVCCMADVFFSLFTALHCAKPFPLHQLAAVLKDTHTSPRRRRRKICSLSLASPCSRRGLVASLWWRSSGLVSASPCWRSRGLVIDVYVQGNIMPPISAARSMPVKEPAFPLHPWRGPTSARGREHAAR